MSLLLVLFEKTRYLGRVVGAVTVATGLALTLLFGKAIEVNSHRVSRPWDLVSPRELVFESRHNRNVALAGMAIGVLANALALRLAKRRPLPSA
jgi:ABC-type nickel/cobalt efflux system permease component RcnA